MNEVSETARVAEEVARASFGRLVALLSARTGDVASAEDAISNAFRKALEKWPVDGIPANPDGWIFSVARNQIRDQGRRNSKFIHDSTDGAFDEIQKEQEMGDNNFPDERLKLLFVCAHPAIDSAIHVPLMLQTVLRVESQAIARAMLMSPSALAQRLVRAKRKIKDARIPFQVPEANELAGRLSAVTEAIYGAYSIGWIADDTGVPGGLSSEALYLALLVARLMPEEAEVLGLAALLSFSHARHAYRLQEEFVPLTEQDPSTWDKPLIKNGNILLNRAQSLKRLGRFQLEAAIQSVHCGRKGFDPPDWQSIAQLYAGLMTLGPTIGAGVGYSVAVGHAFGADAGLAVLDKLDSETLKTFQPGWAARGYLLEMAERHGEASKALSTAIALTKNPRLLRYLRKKKTLLAQLH